METTPPLTPARRCSYLAVRIVEKRPEIPRQTTLLPPEPPSPLIFSACSERSGAGGDAGEGRLCGAYLGATEGLGSSGYVFDGIHFPKGWLICLKNPEEAINSCD